MKLPRSVLLRRQEFQEKPTVKEPETGADFYDEGVTNEESGDRWFSSDLSKAIRFYYRAHESYKKALKLEPTMIDALYNLPRLEYEVYNKYIKDEAVILNDLDNCAEALSDNKVGGLFQNISSICRCFETSLELLTISGNEVALGWEYYFNAGMCYFEYAESLCSELSILQNLSAESELVKVVERCIFMFQKALGLMESISNSESNDETINSETLASVCIESFRMLSAIYETLYSQNLVSIMDQFTEYYLEQIDFLSSKLLQNSLSQDTLNALKIAKINERASRELNFDTFCSIWMSENSLNDLLEKQLIETSSFRSFIDKFETAGIAIPDENKWNILSILNSKYKAINNVLRLEVDELSKRTNTENDLLSTKISLLCSVFIERADIDLERSLLDTNEALQNRQVLMTNSKNLLKNALIFSKKSGGIKESACGKLTRNKRQREAAMRLCLLEGKPQETWNKIIGENYWPIELNALADIDAYKQFFN